MMLVDTCSCGAPLSMLPKDHVCADPAALRLERELHLQRRAEAAEAKAEALQAEAEAAEAGCRAWKVVAERMSAEFTRRDKEALALQAEVELQKKRADAWRENATEECTSRRVAEAEVERLTQVANLEGVERKAALRLAREHIARAEAAEAKAESYRVALEWVIEFPGSVEAAQRARAALAQTGAKDENA